MYIYVCTYIFTYIHIYIYIYIYIYINIYKYLYIYIYIYIGGWGNVDEWGAGALGDDEVVKEVEKIVLQREKLSGCAISEERLNSTKGTVLLLFMVYLCLIYFFCTCTFQVEVMGMISLKSGCIKARKVLLCIFIYIMCMYIYTYICIYTYVYIYMYIYMYTYVYAYMCIYTYIYVNIFGLIMSYYWYFFVLMPFWLVCMESYRE
jgi:hypothetical protein